ncbi:MAG: ABC transporter permease [Chloroflexota bacterium]|nr:ABC transporter permease [Chloroflexota bacterium]MDE2857331.1 ABC transporter permease [Chloroflexota bacterium]MDE2951808.1 ABC transporter permease [Chloroflexota bacterium]
MIGYILRRLLSLAFVLFVVSLIVFVLMNLVPGGPFTLADRGYSGAALENLERKYGLDKPVHVRYLNYVTSALQLDFGNSFSVAGNPPVTELIARIWPVTFQLGLYTILLSFGLGIFLGIVAAYYHNSIIDNLVTFIATAGIAVPNFIIATWFLLIFGFQNGWGAESKWIIGPIIADGAAIFSWDYILPVVTYALAPLALVSRYTRSSFTDVLKADFIRTARSKGLSERMILLRHILRNALIPMITVLLPQIPNLLTGSLFIEVVYGVPGLGKFFVTSIFNRDYPMIMGLVLLIALLWGLTYLVTDILYTVIDPRIRLGGRQGA